MTLSRTSVTLLLLPLPVEDAVWEEAMVKMKCCSSLHVEKIWRGEIRGSKI